MDKLEPFILYLFSRRSDPPNQSEIRRFLNYPQKTLYNHIQYLKRKDFIQEKEEIFKKGRQKIYTLTTKGLALAISLTRPKDVVDYFMSNK